MFAVFSFMFSAMGLATALMSYISFIAIAYADKELFTRWYARMKVKYSKLDNYNVFFYISNYTIK